MLTLPEHPTSPMVVRAVRFARSIVVCVMFYRSLFVLVFLIVVFSVILRFTVLITPLVSSSSSCVNRSFKLICVVINIISTQLSLVSVIDQCYRKPWSISRTSADRIDIYMTYGF